MNILEQNSNTVVFRTITALSDIFLIAVTNKNEQTDTNNQTCKLKPSDENRPISCCLLNILFLCSN